jgi:hypothetical protein
VPTTKDQLLFFRYLNPFQSGATIYGLLPAHVTSKRDRVIRIVRRLVSENGSEEYPLVSSLPSYIHFEPTSPLTQDDVRELWFIITSRTAVAGNLTRDIDLLNRYRTDPWGKADAEFKIAMQRMKGSAIEQPSVGQPSSVPSRADFDRWWRLTTDPEHATVVKREMPRAWDGAIKFQERARQR